MARIRTIKPEFFTSEDIVSLTPLARLFYVSLWCEADREGRLEWRPKTLKIRYLPCDDVDIDVLASEIVARGMLAIYEVDGKLYAELPNFTKHQVINNREQQSTLPCRVTDASPTRGARVKAEGRKGKERNPRDDACVDAGEKFWEAWPSGDRKQDKAKCIEKFKANRLDEHLQAILDDIAAKRLTQKWRDGYIEAPLVYLNNRRWEDGHGGGHTESSAMEVL